MANCERCGVALDPKHVITGMSCFCSDGCVMVYTQDAIATQQLPVVVDHPTSEAGDVPVGQNPILSVIPQVEESAPTTPVQPPAVTTGPPIGRQSLPTSSSSSVSSSNSGNIVDSSRKSVSSSDGTASRSSSVSSTTAASRAKKKNQVLIRSSDEDDEPLSDTFDEVSVSQMRQQLTSKGTNAMRCTAL